MMNAQKAFFFPKYHSFFHGCLTDFNNFVFLFSMVLDTVVNPDASSFQLEIVIIVFFFQVRSLKKARLCQRIRGRSVIIFMYSNNRVFSSFPFSPSSRLFFLTSPVPVFSTITSQAPLPDLLLIISYSYLIIQIFPIKFDTIQILALNAEGFSFYFCFFYLYKFLLENTDLLGFFKHRFCLRSQCQVCSYIPALLFQVKRQKLFVPDVHAAMQELEEEADVSENFDPSSQSRVPYVQIDTFTSFLENFHKIEVFI